MLVLSRNTAPHTQLASVLPKAVVRPWQGFQNPVAQQPMLELTLSGNILEDFRVLCSWIPQSTGSWAGSWLPQSLMAS